MQARTPFLLIAMLGMLGVGAQRPEQLRVAANTVVVDLVATDRSNRHVMDLSRDELQVFEDNVRQEIDSLSAVHKPTTEPSAIPAQEAGTQVIHASKEALGNLMVLLLDYATVEFVHQDRVRSAAVRYVRESMHESDVLAVFRVGSSFELVQNFTNDKEKLVAALQKTDPTGSKFAFDQAFLLEQAQSAGRSVDNLASNIASMQSNPSAFGPTVSLAITILSRQQEVVERMEARAYAELSASKEIQARPVIAALDAVAQGLQRFPGRKTLILLSEGFAVGGALERHLYHAVDRANKANVAVYAIDGAGLRHKEPNPEGELHDISALQQGDRARVSMGMSQFDRAREIGSDQADSTLRYITSATGGVLIRHTNDLFGALQRIDNDLRSHYILTYRPSNPNFDGSFRTINVKTTRPGVTLRFRQGYFAVPPGASLIMPDEYELLTRARSGKLQIDEANLEFQPYSFLDTDGRFRVVLSIEFPARLTESQAVGGARVLYPRVWGTVQSESGEVVTSFRSPSKVVLAGDDSGSISQQQVSLQNELSLAPGRYSVEVFAQLRERNRPSYQARSLSLRYPTDPGLSLSSIVLSNRSTLDSRASQLEHFPSATRRFQNRERIVFYLHAYNPTVDSSRKVALEVRATVMNDTKSFRASLDPFLVSRLDAGGVPHAEISRFIELEKLPPGRYQLETRVRDTLSSSIATALTTFTVESGTSHLSDR
jgi:VWFA-related protein